MRKHIFLFDGVTNLSFLRLPFSNCYIGFPLEASQNFETPKMFRFWRIPIFEGPIFSIQGANKFFGT
jgi:hypothetical protein